MFTPVDKTRAFEAVVNQIESAIYSGAYAPGDHLPSERALVDEFAVGRSTVREALRVLESMGLVTTSAGSRTGPRVCASVTPGLTRMLRGAVRMEQLPLVELIQYRMIAGSAANQLAAHLRTDAHLDRMGAAITAMEAAPLADAAAFAAADDQFHSVIREAAGNGLLDTVSGVIRDVTLDLIARAVDVAEPAATRRDFVAVHRQILEAIAERDADTAARLSRRTLFDAYASQLQPAERARLALLLGDGPDRRG